MKPFLQKAELMSMLKTHEGESKIKPEKGEKCRPSSLSLRLCLVAWTKQGSQGERKRKLQEGHLWRDVHEQKEVVTFLLSWLPNCVGGEAGIAMIIPYSRLQFGLQVYTNSAI